MKRELEEKLFRQFPWLEARNVWSGKKLGFCISMSCDDGWYQLINDLCKGIDKVLKNCSPEFVEGFFVEQVKEKFSTLRFYTSYGNDEIFGLITEAEEKSSKTCEHCGNDGELCTRHSWLRTLCDKCRVENGFEKCRKEDN
jgi:hypothetical protein